MPTTTTKNLMVQLSVPITLLDIEVEELTPEAILNAVANDLRDDNRCLLYTSTSQRD